MAVAEAVAAVVTLLVGLTLCTSTTTSSSSAAAAAGRSGRRWREEDCGGVRGEVTYDHRALVLNGTRRMLFSGEMHYPRSTPEASLPRNTRPRLSLIVIGLALGLAATASGAACVFHRPPPPRYGCSWQLEWTINASTIHLAGFNERPAGKRNAACSAGRRHNFD